MFEEPPAGPNRADPKRGGQKTLSCSPKLTMNQIVATLHSLQDAVMQLTRMSRSFLNWAGKAERLSFDVPTLPLFVHDRLSTRGVIETLQGHRKDKGAEQLTLAGLFRRSSAFSHCQGLRSLSKPFQSWKPNRTTMATEVALEFVDGAASLMSCPL